MLENDRCCGAQTFCHVLDTLGSIEMIWNELLDPDGGVFVANGLDATTLADAPAGAAAEGGAYPAGGDKEGGTAAFARLAALLRAGGFDVQVYPERPGVVRKSPLPSLACSSSRRIG